MIDEQEYDQKFNRLIEALKQARSDYEDATPELKEQYLVQWQALKNEFNTLVSSRRQSEVA